MILILRDILGPTGLGWDIPAYALLGFLSFRAAMALILAFIMSLVVAPPLIAKLRAIKAGQQVRDDKGGNSISLKEMHGAKVGTPTAGGIMIVAALVLPVLLLADLRNPLTSLLLLVTLGFAFIGFLDDYLKISKKNSKGLPGRYKMLGQAILGIIVGAYLIAEPHQVTYAAAGEQIRGTTYLAAPFMKSFYVNLGWFYIPFVILVLTATSNAVNLTDGLDGLAIGVSIIVSGAFAIITYLVSRPDYAAFLLLPHVQGAGEACVLLAALIGGGMGFLWFNAHPAQIFMGDTGSLMIGGVLGTVAVVTKSELLLLIIGGVFVLEAVSVILQVGSFRLLGRRIFKMAPIHHHFEKCGWKEPQIIARFYIIASLLALFGLSTLRMR